MRGRISAKVRWASIVIVLIAVSSLASLWRPAPDAPATVVIDLWPAIVTVPSALGPPVATGCKGSPQPNDPLLGGQDGVLAIAMNSLSLVDWGPDGVPGTPDDSEAVILNAPKDLNFALPPGSDAGDFVSGAEIPAGTYEAIKGEMDNIFRVMCAVPCETDAANPGTEVYVTKGKGSLAGEADGLGPTMPGGGPALQSNLDISGGAGPQAFNFPLTPAIEVTEGGSAQQNLAFSATGACELFDVSEHTVPPGAPGTSFKIVPMPQSAQPE